MQVSPTDMKITLKLAPDTKKPVNERPPKEKSPFLEEKLPAVSGGKAPAAPNTGRRILVVDDNPIVLKAFELKLRASGFMVTTILNVAAVASAAESSEAELIILDINFSDGQGSDWTGYTSMKWLQRFPKLSKIPVILISGEDAKQHKAKALAAGAVAFFEKPVPYPELLAAVFSALHVEPNVAEASKSISTIGSADAGSGGTPELASDSSSAPAHPKCGTTDGIANG